MAPGPKAKDGAKEVRTTMNELKSAAVGILLNDGPPHSSFLAHKTRLVAGEVMAYFKQLGYQVADNSGGAVT